MKIRAKKKESKLLKKARTMVSKADDALAKAKQRRESFAIESKLYTKVIN